MQASCDPSRLTLQRLLARLGGDHHLAAGLLFFGEPINAVQAMRLHAARRAAR